MSTYAGDDLTPILTPRPPSGIGYRQGVVVTWDNVTGANVIDIGGTQHTNVPYLNTSEVGLISAGDVVGILTASPSWFVLGRIITPGS
ncbi:hypothetical protein [Micromonospora sp. NPDC047730]|uniref:hypothetical protein n=1 Tax=Micromonospora sp. NPDC047730 TaxID=3364253 RepID=UPI00371166EE